MAGQSLSPMRTRNSLGTRKSGTTFLDSGSEQPLDKAAKRLQSPFHSMASEPSRTTWSSAGSVCLGILLERHLYSPGERKEASIDQHILSMSHISPVRFDYRKPSGEFQTIVIRPETILVTPAGVVPHIRLHTPADFTHCAFEENFLRRVASEIDHPLSYPPFSPGLEDQSIARILSLLTDEARAQRPLNRLYSDSLVYALATRYLLMDVTKPQQPRSRVTGLRPRILNRVRDVIEANIDTDVSLESLAKETGYSRAHFLRMFRVATGLTPYQYVLEVRLKRAQESLKQANSNIIDVALSCGFASQSHMTNVFRRHLAVTPGEFRRHALVARAGDTL